MLSNKIKPLLISLLILIGSPWLSSTVHADRADDDVIVEIIQQLQVERAWLIKYKCENACRAQNRCHLNCDEATALQVKNIDSKLARVVSVETINYPTEFREMTASSR